MPQLIAQGPRPKQRWRRQVEAHRSITVGRSEHVWDVPWDDRISRQHARLQSDGQQLLVERIPDSRNPIFFQGHACDRCCLQIGDSFVIGSTTFAFVEERLGVTLDAPRPRTEQAFSRDVLQTVPFRDASQLIESLSRLPEMIKGAANDEELFMRLVDVVLRSVEAATMVAILAHSPSHPERSEILHWDRAEQSTATPSERLIRRALDTGQSVAHLWSHDRSAEAATFTQSGDAAWAFCTPVRSLVCPGWVLYVAGERSVQDPAALRDDIKFTEMVALMLANLRDLKHLEGHRATLRQFISPVVLAAVSDQDPDHVLAPREADVSVLFCDLRGFTLKSERQAGDLMGLLQRVSMALGVMTQHILAEDGVIGDFHGDAAMGFWGWPLTQADRAERACRAAMGIVREFAAAQQPDHPLADFRVGLGIASGRAVAGKIGTVDQVKVTVFGPVVNLASRLEEMTKLLRAPVLIDEPTAAMIRQRVPRATVRVRRVARMRPYGMETPVEVSQLLPPFGEYRQLSDDDIASYEQAWDAVQTGNWERAFELLHAVPAEDRVKDFLTIFIAQNNRVPPADWDGVIPVPAK